MSPAHLDWKALTQDFLKELTLEDFKLLKSFISLFGDVNDCNKNTPAGRGPEIAAARLRASDIKTLVALVSSPLPQCTIPKKSYKPSYSTAVEKEHPVMKACYTVEHEDHHSTRTRLGPVVTQLESEAPTWVICNQIPLVLFCEADTSAMVCMNTIKPCSELLNLKLFAGSPQGDYEIHVRAQYKSKTERGHGSKQDYALLLHNPYTEDEWVLTLIEFKQPGVIELDVWKDRALPGMGYTIQVLKNFLRWLPQVVKYAGELDLSYLAVVDGRHFLPLVVGGEVSIDNVEMMGLGSKKEVLAAGVDRAPRSAYQLTSWDSELPLSGTGYPLGPGLSLVYLICEGLLRRVPYRGPKSIVPPMRLKGAPRIDLMEPRWNITDAVAHLSPP